MQWQNNGDVMNCPKCDYEIPRALITAARQSELGSRDRPGAIGLVRRGCKHVAPSLVPARHSLLTDCVCLHCHRSIRWSTTRNTFLLARKKEGKVTLTRQYRNREPDEWQKCPCCDGKGTIGCYQDGQPGLDWCHECDGMQQVPLWIVRHRAKD